MEKPALFGKFLAAVPIWTMPLVLLVPFVTTRPSFKLMQWMVVGKTTRIAPVKAILTLQGAITRWHGSPWATFWHKLPLVVHPMALAARVPVVYMFSKRVNTIKTRPTANRNPSGRQNGHRRPVQSTIPHLVPSPIPMAWNPPVRQLDAFRSNFSATLTVIRRLVSCVKETSAFSLSLTPVTVLPNVLRLTEDGIDNFPRLLALNMVSLIGTTPFVHLTEDISTLSCLFRIPVAFVIRAPPGMITPFVRTGLSSCSPIVRLLARARLRRT